MARRTRKIREESSDDDAPEIVSQSTSKADARRSQKALLDFEAGEKARRKARNRDRDQKLKERARVTKGEKTNDRSKRVRFAEEDGDAGESGEVVDDIEARMLKAMRDAADEVVSDEVEMDGDNDDEDEDDEGFEGFEEGLESDDDGDDGEDADMSSASRQNEPEAQIDDDDDMDGDEDEDDDGRTSFPAKVLAPKKNVSGYLADDLFLAAFTSQNSKPPQKTAEPTSQQTIRKRRRKSVARTKDLVVGGRTIRTLPRLSDPRSQATTRSIPSARARKFMNNSLALKGKQALLRAKKKGWERRPANVGVMKSQGAPQGFVRSTR